MYSYIKAGIIVIIRKCMSACFQNIRSGEISTESECFLRRNLWKANFVSLMQSTSKGRRPLRERQTIKVPSRSKAGNSQNQYKSA